MTNGLDMGVPPCQSNRVKSACSKLDLVFSSAIADVKDILHSFTPLRKTGNSFGAFERASHAAKAAVTPWSIIICNWALVTIVALTVSWSAVDLVVRLGAICF
nr:hypothetical protein [Tanacetum cinerariifolium]